MSRSKVGIDSVLSQLDDAERVWVTDTLEQVGASPKDVEGVLRKLVTKTTHKGCEVSIPVVMAGATVSVLAFAMAFGRVASAKGPGLALAAVPMFLISQILAQPRIITIVFGTVFPDAIDRYLLAARVGLTVAMHIALALLHHPTARAVALACFVANVTLIVWSAMRLRRDGAFERQRTCALASAAFDVSRDKRVMDTKRKLQSLKL